MQTVLDHIFFGCVTDGHLKFNSFLISIIVDIFSLMLKSNSTLKLWNSFIRLSIIINCNWELECFEIWCHFHEYSKFVSFKIVWFINPLWIINLFRSQLVHLKLILTIYGSDVQDIFHWHQIGAYYCEEKKFRKSWTRCNKNNHWELTNKTIIFIDRLNSSRMFWSTQKTNEIATMKKKEDSEPFLFY